LAAQPVGITTILRGDGSMSDCCEETAPTMPLIGDMAPAFVAPTTQGEINFPADYQGKWVILFSHPADFTPVCTTEFMTFAHMYPQFQARDCELIGLSIDSNYSHIAWLRTIAEKVAWKGMSGVQVMFPVIADPMGTVAILYGMLQPKADTTKAVRAVFFIDPKGIVRAMLYYPMSNGRNFAEIYRLLVAMQTSDEHGIATPADWEPGDEVIVPPPGSCGAAKDRVDTAEAEGIRVLDWFLAFRKLEPR
jgi:peroxiredoxin 2/4